MNSPILPVRGPSDLPSSTPSASGAADLAALIAELAAGEGAVAIRAERGGPPPEVLDSIVAAATIEQALRASGQRVRFHSPAPGQDTRIELDGPGATTALSVSQAVELATGRPLD
jgi:hypothetical protein